MGLFLLSPQLSNAQVYHESFENFFCEYNCNTPCFNYFYSECIPNWFSASNEPRLLKNSCNTLNGVYATDGEYFSGIGSLGRNVFFELTNGETFQPGTDYFISYDVYNDGGSSLNLLIDGFNNLSNVDGVSTDGNLTQSLIIDDLWNQGVWEKHHSCFSVGTQSFNQLLFSLHATTNGQNMPPTDCYDPWVTFDNVKVICQQDYEINEIKNDIVVTSCIKNRTFELIPLGSCTNDLTNYPYTVELYNQGQLVNSFSNTGYEFVIDFDIYDDNTYTIKVQDLNSDECNYTIPTLTIDLSTDLLQNHNIISTVVWDDYQITNQDIVINSGGFLTVKGVILFTSDARLIVERGGKLVLDHGELRTCADEWPGVIVKGNSILDQPDPNGLPSPSEAGILISKNRSIIEKAHVGISTNYYGAWTDQDWGGLVQCELTEFLNCWKGVEFMKYEKENKSFFKYCRFNDSKEGVSIWACNGILFENNNFDNLTTGILSVDAEFRVWFNNTIQNCENGILAMAGSNGIADIEIERNNQFLNNDFGIILSGNTGTKLPKIDRNYFERNHKAILIDGDTRYLISNNNFTDNGYNTLSYSTNYHVNRIVCNEMIDQQWGGIAMLYDNQLSTFLSNNLIGTSSFGFDVYGNNADIADDIGTEYLPALNLFSGIQDDIDWDNSNESFNYWILKTNPLPRSIPQNTGNFVPIHNAQDLDNIDCYPIIPTVTKSEVIISITQYCYWLNLYRQNPSNPYYRKMFLEAKQILLIKYYYWLNQDVGGPSWEEVEELLKTLCDDHWKIKLYGHYMKHNLYYKADSLLTVLEDPNLREPPIVPEDLSDESRESFIAIQKINLKYMVSNGSYQLSPIELSLLQTEAERTIPESAYAKGLYMLVTGEYLARDLPDRLMQELEPRSSEMVEVANWTIYPNPANDLLYINYTANVGFNGKMVVYDLLGSKVLEKHVKFESKSENYLNVSTLKDGVYILTIKDKENEIIKSQKVMINSN